MPDLPPPSTPAASVTPAPSAALQQTLKDGFLKKRAMSRGAILWRIEVILSVGVAPGLRSQSYFGGVGSSHDIIAAAGLRRKLRRP